jgi:hypothetical protein
VATVEAPTPEGLTVGLPVERMMAASADIGGDVRAEKGEVKIIVPNAYFDPEVARAIADVIDKVESGEAYAAEGDYTAERLRSSDVVVYKRTVAGLIPLLLVTAQPAIVAKLLRNAASDAEQEGDE